MKDNNSILRKDKTQSRKELIQSNKTQSVTRIFLKFIMNVNEVNCSTSQTTVKKESNRSQNYPKSLLDR